MELGIVAPSISQEIPAGTRRVPQEAIWGPDFLPVFLDMVLGQAIAGTIEAETTGAVDEVEQVAAICLAVVGHASLAGFDGISETQVSVHEGEAHETIMAADGPVFGDCPGKERVEAQWDKPSVSQATPPVGHRLAQPEASRAAQVESVVTDEVGVTPTRGAARIGTHDPGVFQSHSDDTRCNGIPFPPRAVSAESAQPGAAGAEPSDSPNPTNEMSGTLEPRFSVRSDPPLPVKVAREFITPDSEARETGETTRMGSPRLGLTEAPTQETGVPTPAERNPSRSVPMELGELARGIVERFKMVRSGERHVMEVELKPEHLGRLTIRVARSPDGVTARFEVQSHATKVLVERNLENLRHTLEEQGIRLGGLGVDIGQDRGRPRQDSARAIAMRCQEPRVQPREGNPRQAVGRIDYLA